MLTLGKNSKDFTILKNTKKALQRLHCNVEFCLHNLGLWGALQVSFHDIFYFLLYCIHLHCVKHMQKSPPFQLNLG